MSIQTSIQMCIHLSLVTPLLVITIAHTHMHIISLDTQVPSLNSNNIFKCQVNVMDLSQMQNSITTDAWTAGPFLKHHLFRISVSTQNFHTELYRKISAYMYTHLHANTHIHRHTVLLQCNTNWMYCEFAWNHSQGKNAISIEVLWVKRTFLMVHTLWLVFLFTC